MQVLETYKQSNKEVMKYKQKIDYNEVRINYITEPVKNGNGPWIV